jgi:uncharacterized paraquat-inducible protein A
MSANSRRNLASPADSKSPKEVRRVEISLAAAEIACLTAGVLLPAIVIRSFWIFTEDISIASALWLLFAEREYLVFGAIFVFSVLVPFTRSLMKLAGFASQAYESLGRLSMTDVMLLAMVVVIVKLSGIQDATIGLGFYFLLAAAILHSAGSFAVRRAARAVEGEAD